MADALTPSMQQYLKAKAEYPDCLVLFRMGDFYELFFEDAVDAAQLLDLTLTSRNKEAPNPIPMAGVPYHAVQGYLSRLVEAGRKVAIVEQMEDPKLAKGLVKREVVRVVTPGVALDSELGDRVTANHLVSVIQDNRGFAIAALDASTGEFQGDFVLDSNDLLTVMGKLVVKEVLTSSGNFQDSSGAVDQLISESGAVETALQLRDLDEELLDEEVQRLLPPPTPPTLRIAAVSLLNYLSRTHKALLAMVRPFSLLSLDTAMLLPSTTIRNLELLHSSSQHGATLFGYLNKTKTSMGARLLRTWLLAPLTNRSAIEERLNRVEALVNEPTLRENVRAILSNTPDLERLLTKLAGGNCSARDLNSIARGIRTFEKAQEALAKCQSDAFRKLANWPQDLVDLAQGIEATFEEDPPATTREGGMVRRQVVRELDEALDMAQNGRQYIANYEAKQKELTGISTLKVRYNKVFGFTIEVSKSQASKAPDYFVRRQTLVNAERYTTTELSELENMVLTAQERLIDIQQQVFEDWRQKVLASTSKIQELAQLLANIDLPACLAEIAHTNGWCRPELHTGSHLSIIEGRHPIVEASLQRGAFVPNDFELDGWNCTLTIITGPNMSGKSTIMRQVALIVLLAQMGSFVPAKQAKIGIADAIFTRVGAMDDLAAGKSTFMVEMSEAAEMLNRSTARSLVILDEIGRGTSTFDGVAIAWAMAEFIQEKIGCRTLFATHYHELTDLVRSVPRTRNCSVAVKEWGGEVLFLRKLVEGPASKSYGIQVARLAGLPDEIITRAKEVLANLESTELDAVGRPRLAMGRGKTANSGQLDLFAAFNEAPDPIISQLSGMNPDKLTPIEALQILTDLVQEARRKTQS